MSFIIFLRLFLYLKFMITFYDITQHFFEVRVLTLHKNVKNRLYNS